jgi:hypothetical protein
VPFEPTPGRGVPGGEAYTGVQAQQEGGVLTEEADPATGTGSGDAPPVPSTVQPTVPTIPIEGPGACAQRRRGRTRRDARRPTPLGPRPPCLVLG